MFSNRYFAARYYAARFFPATAAPEGSIYASVSGAALVAASMSAAGWADAGLLGAGELAALLTAGTGYIAAFIAGSSALTARATERRRGVWVAAPLFYYPPTQRLRAHLWGRGTLAGTIKGRKARPVPPAVNNANLMLIAG
jgi:hypothetical protein